MSTENSLEHSLSANNALFNTGSLGVSDHFKTLTENSAAGIYILHGDYFVYVNQRMADIHGYTIHEMTEKKFWEFIHPEFSEKVKQRAIDRQKGLAVPTRYELKIITKSGETKWVELVANQTRLDDKFVILGTVLDVTERQAMSEAVIYNSRLQKLLASISSDFINVNPENLDQKINTMLSLSGTFFNADRCYLLRLDQNGTHLSNTHEWSVTSDLSLIQELQNIKISDYPWIQQQFKKNELLSIPDVSALPDYAQNEKELFERQGVKSLYTFPIIQQGKQFGFFGFDYVTGHYNWNQNQIQFFTVITEIIANAFERVSSELKVRYQQNLQELLIRLSTRFINLPTDEIENAIALSLRELGQFVQADRAYIFDYDFENNISRYRYEWCNEGISPEIENHPVLPLELCTDMVKYHLSGKYFLISDVDSLPDRDLMKPILAVQGIKSMVTFPMISDNDCLGFVGFDSVIQSHEYSEKEKQLLEVFAQMLVNVRVRYALQKNLLKAKSDAELASKYKSDFLANMSHEIRTPIHGIVGYLDLLLNTNLSAEQRQYLEYAKISSGNLIEIINDILDFSKIEAGKMEIEEVEVDVTGIVNETLSILKPIAAQKKILFLVSIDDNIPKSIFLDPLRLKQVLMNLLSNALKFTDEGQIKLDVNFSRSDNLIGELHIEVMDTGIGISDAEKNKIFSAFTQADSNTTRKYGGTGLGLVISSSLIEKMGGSIGFESTPGKGSTFYFKLTKRYKDINALNQPKIIDSPQLAVVPNDYQKKIMVVEDVEMNALLIKTILAKNFPNATIIEAVNGVEAVALYKEHFPDIILMDIRMPLMNGFDATKEIRLFEMNAARRAIIIALTAEAVKSELDKCIESGMDDFITKPINTKKFLDQILMYSGRIKNHIDDSNLETTEIKRSPKVATHFDKSSLIDRVDGDFDFARQLVDMGIQEIELQLAKLTTIIEDEKWDELKENSHRLKGLCRSISFILLGDLFEKLEISAKSEMPDKNEIQHLHNTIEFEYNFVRESDLLDD